MRIISGKFRAKKLTPPKHNIRPTLDKVKQALFTKLQFDIEGSVILDLFAGSGAIGIEAISRDAKKVVFVDNNEKSIALTKLNLKSLKTEMVKTEIQVVKSDYLLYLQNSNEKFDIIILDPPYESDFYVKALEIIYSRQLLNVNGIIVCERLKEKQIIQDYFEVETTKNYGTVSLDYLIIKQKNN